MRTGSGRSSGDESQATRVHPLRVGQAKKPAGIDASTGIGQEESADTSAISSSERSAASPETQFTQYSTPHNHVAGFVEARALAQQSLVSGEGSLLKKRFLLEEVLGEGGMGTVYKAKDLRKVEAEDPNPYIAIKVLNSEFKDHPDAFVTLQQEAAKSQALAHPNIVTVHDFDRDGDILFMTMELLEGEPLDKLLRRKPGKIRPKQQIWSLVRDLCIALAYAHKRQLIHADLKPGNIFITRDGHAKVLDFGIACAASKESQKHPFDACKLGALTPAYSTIEKVKDEPLSFSDDVYSLACVVYEMFAGRHPFGKRSAYEAQQGKKKPARLEQLNARQWKALSHALALEKSARTPTVQQFMRELFPRRGNLSFKLALGIALISLIGAGWFAYRQYQNRLQAQRLISEKLATAQSCFDNRDFSCAIEQSLVAVSLDPKNAAAAKLLKAAQLAKQNQADEAKVGQLLTDANECLARDDANCVKVKAGDVLALLPGNIQAQQLLARANDQLKVNAINDLVRQGEECLQSGNLICAQLFSDRANAIDAQHRASLRLAEELADYRQRQAQESEARAHKIQKLLGQADQCFERKDYPCAIDKSKQVLDLDAANVRAIELKQSATLEWRQAKETARKISKLLADAEKYMDRKMYDRAIDRANSVLELSSGNPKAQALKARAQEILQELKNIPIR